VPQNVLACHHVATCSPTRGHAHLPPLQALRRTLWPAARALSANPATSPLPGGSPLAPGANTDAGGGPVALPAALLLLALAELPAPLLPPALTELCAAMVRTRNGVGSLGSMSGALPMH
jgi:hypothetical protein